MSTPCRPRGTRVGSRIWRGWPHQLKGSSAGYGFSSIGDAAGALEGRLLSLRDSESEAAIEGLSAEFRKLVDLVHARIAGR